LIGFGHVAAATALALVLLLQGARATAEELRVVVTLKPVHSLVAAVMEGVGSPDLLLDGAASPHAYALKPSEARLLQRAQLVVRVSAELETFLAKPLATLPQGAKVLTLDRLKGMRLHRLRGGAAFGGNGHDGHRHHHGHDHGSHDPHLWLDPENAKVAALAVAEELARLAPGEAERFRANAGRLVARLQALSERLATSLQPLGKLRFLVFHDAYQYLERRFGLAAAGAVTMNPETPPSARRIAALRRQLTKDGIACVFAEPQFPPRIIDSIVEGTSTRRGTLDPLGAAIPAGPEHYATLLETMGRDLAGCLQGGT
jgi:zinc transport system substrate-binding protein